MLTVNPDLLIEIGKKIVETGTEKDVIKFALSGKEPLQAMKKVFASVTHLELYKDHYCIGWDGEFCTLSCDSGKTPPTAFLMNYIGSCVQKFGIDAFPSIYETIIDNILAKKQLISLSVGESCRMLFLHKFLPLFYSSLEHIEIPHNKINSLFRDSFNLKSLILSGSVKPHFALYCCKTEKLEFSNPETVYSASQVLENMSKKSLGLSPNLSGIKELIFNETWLCLYPQKFAQIMKFFPSVDSLHFKCTIPKNFFRRMASFVQCCIRRLVEIIKTSPKVPSKLTFSFLKDYCNFEVTDLENCKAVCEGYTFDDDFDTRNYCFRQTVESTGDDSTEILIQICK